MNCSWTRLVGASLALIAPLGLVLRREAQAGPSGSCHGYTFSLLLFAGPTLAMSAWYARQRRFDAFKPLLWCCALVTLVWSALDVLLAPTFFVFANRAATLGLDFWGYWPGRGFERSIPGEELAFYALGAVTIQLGYQWLSDAVFADSAPPEPAPSPPRAWLPALLPGFLALSVGVAFRVGVSDLAPGFPGYLCFLVLAIWLPTQLLFRSVGARVNAPACVTTLLLMVFVGHVWEELALPRGWWSYRPAQMLGIFIGPWSGLPLEAVLLWGLAVWNNVTLLEAGKLVHSRGWSALVRG